MKENFGNRLKAFRLAKGMTLQQFADAVGAKSPSNINAWESPGGSLPSSPALARVYNAFPELSKEYLENGIEPMQLPLTFSKSQQNLHSTQDCESLKNELLATKAKLDKTEAELIWAKGMIKLLDKDKIFENDDILGKWHGKFLQTVRGTALPYRTYPD